MDGQYFLLRPEVPGGWGTGIVANTGTHPPQVSRLHIQFDGWVADDLLTSFPCFFVTQPLAAGLSQSGLSGYDLAPMQVTHSQTYEQLHGDKPVPPCLWLKVTGTPGEQDFGLTVQGDLVVSRRALDLLRRYALRDCDVSDWAA